MAASARPAGATRAERLSVITLLLLRRRSVSSHALGGHGPSFDRQRRHLSRRDCPMASLEELPLASGDQRHFLEVLLVGALARKLVLEPQAETAGATRDHIW